MNAWSYCITTSPKSNGWHPYKQDIRKQTHTKREDGCVKTEAETGEM